MFCLHIYVHHVHVWCHGSQKMTSDPLKLELWAVVSPDVVLETKPETSARATNALNHLIISLAPDFFKNFED